MVVVPKLPELPTDPPLPGESGDPGDAAMARCSCRAIVLDIAVSKTPKRVREVRDQSGEEVCLDHRNFDFRTFFLPNFFFFDLSIFRRRLME